jgi:hypothetical protein
MLKLVTDKEVGIAIPIAHLVKEPCAQTVRKLGAGIAPEPVARRFPRLPVDERLPVAATAGVAGAVIPIREAVRLGLEHRLRLL